MFTEDFNENEFGMPSLLDFELSRPQSLFDLDFEDLDRLPQFELEPTISRCLIALPPFETACEAEKHHSEADTKSNSDNQGPRSLKRTRSVMSFDSDALGSDFQAGANNEAADQDPNSFDRLLLRMVDQESLSFAALLGPALTEELKEFLACNIEVMTKKSFPVIPEETNEAWIARATSHLQQTTKKRKDQKLRMIFNKIVKMLVNTSGKKETGRESKASRLQGFLDKYAPKDKETFENFIKDCKFPSKKKLKSIFKQYKAFRSDFEHILSDKIFYNEYLIKRKFKATRLLNNFHEAQSKFGSNRTKIVASLRDCIKSFPWSIEDLTTSCDLLYSTLGEGQSF